MGAITRNQVKWVESLRVKKFRQKYSQFIIEGEKSLNELQSSPLIVTDIFGTAAWMQHYAARWSGRAALHEVTDDDLKKISVHQAPQAVLAVVTIPEYPIERPQEGIWSIALEGIQDPGNLGTIIRIADWYGISTIYCSSDCVDAYGPKVVNATMGSLLRVKVIETDLNILLADGTAPVYAAVLEGEDIHQLPQAIPGVILIGNEGRGLSDELRKLASHRVAIPAFGKAESLNAAVATAIICDNFRRLSS